MGSEIGTICEGPSDPQADGLYDYLVAREHFDPGLFQRPVWTTFVAPKGDTYQALARTLGTDECRRSQQIYQQALRLAEQCVAEPASLPCDRLAKGMGAYVEIPWFPASDNVPLKWLELRGEMSRWEQGIRSDLEGVVPGTTEYRTELMRRFVTRLFLPRAQGGGGMRFDASETPPRSLEQIARERSLTCVDLGTLSRSLHMAGVELVLLELFQDSSGQGRAHVMVGVVAPETKVLEKIVDLSEKTWQQSPEHFYFGPPRVGDVFGTITDLEFHSIYYSRRSATDDQAEQEKQDGEISLSMNPFNYASLFNSVVGKRCQDAISFLSRAVQSNPLFTKARERLKICGEMVHETTKDLAFWKKARQKIDYLP